MATLGKLQYYKMLYPTKCITKEDKRRQDVLQILEEIRIRRENRSSDIKWLDSTELIREDRNR